MPKEIDYQNRQLVLSSNICNLFYDLNPSTYDEIAPKVGHWIEFVLSEQWTTTADLVDQVSCVAWEDHRGSHSEISRFLKEFRDAPLRSEQSRSFVDGFCLQVLQWFAAASLEDTWGNWSEGLVSKKGGPGYIRWASFVGHLIERGLLGHELLRRYLYKPLTAHHYNKDNSKKQAIRAHAIYQLFAAAGNTLLQGLLEPEEVENCFDKLDIRVSLGKIGGMDEFDPEKLKEFREIHTKWLQRRKKGEQRKATPDVPAEDANTPVAFVPQDLPGTHVGVEGPSSPLEGIELPLFLRGLELPPETTTSAHDSTVPSPTMSFSSISDLTPTEFGEDIVECRGEQAPTRHKTFYLEDGNVEILCENVIFRIHSPVVSFSSSRLRDMFSQSTLLNAPTPGGCPRVVSEDSAEDFAVLLKMIYTPGFPPWNKVPEFRVFASLLRMATKYGFSDIREQLVHSLKGAYPTKWEEYQAASILGEDIFGSPRPHPNAVLNLFLQQNVRFAIPLAAYRATVGGFSSLINEEPGSILPRLTLASTVYGMEVVHGGVAELANTMVINMMEGDCLDKKCASEQGAKELDGLCDVVIKGLRSSGMFSSLPLGDIVCVACAKTVEQVHGSWCEVVWENLPRIFMVGKSWEEILV